MNDETAKLNDPLTDTNLKLLLGGVPEPDVDHIRENGFVFDRLGAVINIVAWIKRDSKSRYVLAKEEYDLFNRVKVSLDGPANFDIGAYSFKGNLFADSLYNPSFLITAALCDPSWNAGKKKLLEGKLVTDREIVDFQARTIEQDKDAAEGWLPVVPHDGMLKIRYYQGITDTEFNDFFGK